MSQRTSQCTVRTPSSLRVLTEVSHLAVEEQVLYLAVEEQAHQVFVQESPKQCLMQRVNAANASDAVTLGVNGENPVHIISDLVLCMEGDSAPEEEEAPEEDDAAPTHLVNSDRGVLFDEAMNEAQVNLANIESIDQEIVTNIVSASMDQSGFC